MRCAIRRAHSRRATKRSAIRRSLRSQSSSLLRRNGFVIGAFENGQLVGIAGLHREEQAKLSHKAVLWGVYVAPEARKRGTGRKLLARAIDGGRVDAGSDADQPEREFRECRGAGALRGLGFSRSGCERGYLQVDGVLHDEIHMARPLP
jgi:GNAT superfamily N-acetyltransferase